MDAKKKPTDNRDNAERIAGSASANLTLHGTASANATVEIYDAHSNPLGSTQADVNGHWTYTPDYAVNQDSESFNVVVDGQATQDFSIRLDGFSPEKTPQTVPVVEASSSSLGVSATDILAGDVGPQLQVALQPSTVTENITADADIAPLDATAPPTITNALDNVGRETGWVESGATIDDLRPHLSGKSEAINTFIQIYDNGNYLASAYVDELGNWQTSLPLESTLQPGEHELTVVDSAGQKSEPFLLTVANPEPVTKPQVTSAFDDFGKVGELVNGSLTDDATPTLFGKAEPFTQVAIYDGTTRVGYAHSGQDGNWYFQAPALGQGSHVFTVVTAGVTSDPFTLTIGAPDSIKPQITTVIDNIGAVTELVSGSTTDDARPTFQGTGEPQTLLWVYDNGKRVGQTYVEQDGSWSYTDETHKLSEGLHSFTFVGDGVTSEPFELNVQDIPEAPKPQVDSAFDNAGAWTGSVTSGATIDDNRPVFSGQAEPDAAVLVYDNGLFIGAAHVGNDGQWTFQPSEFRALRPGEHTFTVTTDGVRSEPFVLHIEAIAQGTQVSAYEGEPGLPSLSDLLQPASELFLGETDISPLSEAAFDLSLAGFNDSLDLASIETTDGISAFVPLANPQPWQQEIANPLG